MIPKYTIAAASPEDLRSLAAIELAAAQLLADYAPESALSETTNLQVLEQAQREGHLWVALADDVPVGFAHVELIEPGAAHLEELDVHPDHGRRGLGTRLVVEVCQWAAANGCDAVTLTTFREAPWNMPFYARLGFGVVSPEQVSASLRAIVEDETRRGLDPSRRVVMRRRSAPIAAEYRGGATQIETPALAPATEVEPVLCRSDAECETLAAFLTDRIYEFNAKATGYDDGRLLAGCIRNDAGDTIAGFNGHTWGGTCELSNVWVDERYRGQGIGALLLRSAEGEAVRRGCAQVVLATHTFQAPGFYERMGYERRYAIEGQPKGYADIVYVKVLRASPVGSQSPRCIARPAPNRVSTTPVVMKPQAS